MSSTSNFPKVDPALPERIKQLYTLQIQQFSLKKKKRKRKKATFPKQVCDTVNLDATSYTSHPPTTQPTTDLCRVKSVQAAHDVFIHGIINHP